MAGRSSVGIVVVVALLLVGLLFTIPLFGMGLWGPMMRGGMMGGYGYPYGMGWGVAGASCSPGY